MALKSNNGNESAHKLTYRSPWKKLSNGHWSQIDKNPDTMDAAKRDANEMSDMYILYFSKRLLSFLL